MTRHERNLGACACAGRGRGARTIRSLLGDVKNRHTSIH
jgi:hypothetical protein